MFQLQLEFIRWSCQSVKSQYHKNAESILAKICSTTAHTCLLTSCRGCITSPVMSYVAFMNKLLMYQTVCLAFFWRNKSKFPLSLCCFFLLSLSPTLFSYQLVSSWRWCMCVDNASVRFQTCSTFPCLFSEFPLTLMALVCVCVRLCVHAHARTRPFACHRAALPIQDRSFRHYRLLSLPWKQWLHPRALGISKKTKHNKLDKWCLYQTHCLLVSSHNANRRGSVASDLVPFLSISICFDFVRYRIWLVSYSRCCIQWKASVSEPHY